ncbi:MAG: AraC family transcriptional regulator [Terrimicrobiaceae bacterium]|nr:AraC family transcriptional regulator [Terrimicrobiaceae bacterium]
MKIIRESTHISGFLYDKPVQELPALTHCGETLCARGHAIAPHAHPGFEFHYLSRGAYGWSVGRQATDQRMGDIFVNYPNELHATGPGTYPESHFLWIGLHLSQLGAEGKRLAALLRRKNCRVLPGCHEAEPILRGLVSQVISHRAHRSAATLAYLQTLIAVIQQRAMSADSESHGDAARLPYSHSIQKAVSYLEKNLDRRLPLSELTAAATMRHVPHFCAQFHREVGVTPAAHHRRLRLHAAREALEQPAFTITMAALQFGFSSSQHFSVCFQREFGVSPMRWRNDPTHRSGSPPDRNAE